MVLSYSVEVFCPNPSSLLSHKGKSIKDLLLVGVIDLLIDSKEGIN